MDFKLINGLLLCIAILYSCSNKPRTNVGDALSSVTGIVVDSQNEYIFSYNKSVKKIYRFNMSNKKDIKSFDVVNPGERHWVFTNSKGTILLELSYKNLSIHNIATGEYYISPINFEGNPISAAYSSESGVFLIYDDLGSIGLFKLNEDGTVNKYWVGGSIIDGADIPLAGDFSIDGDLLFTYKTGKMILVDVLSTLAAEKWVYSEINTEIKEVNYLSNYQGYYWFAYGNSEANIFELLPKSTIPTVIATETELNIMHSSKSNVPHLVGESIEGTKTIYYPNSDKIIKKDYIASGDITFSYIDREYSSISIISKNDSRYQFSKSRLSDGLVQFEKLVDWNNDYAVTNSYLFAQFPSALGYVELLNFEDKSKTTIKNFNIRPK